MEIYCDNVRPWNLIQDKKSYNKSLATANWPVHSFPSLISSYYKIITIYILLHLANVFVWEIRFCINLINNTFFKAKVWQNALHTRPARRPLIGRTRRLLHQLKHLLLRHPLKHQFQIVVIQSLKRMLLVMLSFGPRWVFENL